MGKPFAILHILGQLTTLPQSRALPYRVRRQAERQPQPLVLRELVVESLVAAGLLDAETARPSATYPRDLFYDCSPNPWLNKYLNLSAEWCPPAQWTEHPYGTNSYVPRRTIAPPW